jgi:type VI secretion system protein ImpM
VSGESLEPQSAERSPGFFGKVPNHGDFVSRRLPGSFLDFWDVWLQGSVAHSRAQLEGRWLDYYLTSPVWRFALSSGVCGDSGWAGVVIPSVDKVGRYYPMTLGAPLDARHRPIDAMESFNSWFDALETLALSCLDDDFELEAFDQHLKSLGPPLADTADSPADAGLPPAPRDSESGKAWRLGVRAAAMPSTVCAELLRHSLNELFVRYSLWWSKGSPQVQPSLLVCEGLPSTARFTALLDGEWTVRGWQDKGPDDAPAASAHDTDT